MSRLQGSDMKKMKASENYTVYAVGDKIYMMIPKDPPSRVIITAHGGHTVVTKTNTFEVPEGLVLRFYSDDGASVLDPGFSRFFSRVSVPKEIISEREICFDYILSKYQGRHGNKNETYASLGNDIDDMYAMAKVHADGIETFADFWPERADDSRAIHAQAKNVPAILTVRNRWFKGDMTLSLALACIQSAAPSVRIVDCLFCRSRKFGGRQKVETIEYMGRAN